MSSFQLLCGIDVSDGFFMNFFSHGDFEPSKGLFDRLLRWIGYWEFSKNP